MEEQEFEQMVKQLLGKDCSEGTEAFRDDLLKRCLAVLDADSEGVPIADEDLDMLAAAGDMWSGFVNLPDDMDVLLF